MVKIEGGSSRDGCCGIFPILPFPHLLCIKRKRFFIFIFYLKNLVVLVETCVCAYARGVVYRHKYVVVVVLSSISLLR